ncbi:VIT family protein [Gordonia sp. AC31]|uniref:VIT1/CCC1 transporter family protein n=1 Tax=Gordonia TaxID=2053 RepID=UPI002880F673|nr:VIT family protein [Gordonia sp. AC31]MDT0223952.1 VIT family protein [Gordonia sp. AC31]
MSADHDRTDHDDRHSDGSADRADGRAGSHSGEPHATAPGRLNWLRAGVLGANDGIVSTAGLVVGVAAATAERGPVLTAGLAGIAAGAVSMALGEYISVSSQRDAERSMLDQERTELRENPEQELAELAALYRAKGLSPETALAVATELTARDPFAAHVDAELGLDPDALTDPWQAAGASALAFLTGAVLPLLAIVLLPVSVRIPLTFLAVLGALALTGVISANLGGAPRTRAVARVVCGGAAAMIVTYLVGQALGSAGV